MLSRAAGRPAAGSHGASPASPPGPASSETGNRRTQAAEPMTTDAQAIIVGGGIMGVSLVWHLTRRGWRDVVLLEKSELTAGSTWHAAGLCTHFAHHPTIMEMRAESVRLYRDVLPAETGGSAGFHPCGALRVTRSAERMAEFRHVQGLGRFMAGSSASSPPRRWRRSIPWPASRGCSAITRRARPTTGTSTRRWPPSTRRGGTFPRRRDPAPHAGAGDRARRIGRVGGAYRPGHCPAAGTWSTRRALGAGRSAR